MLMTLIFGIVTCPLCTFGLIMYAIVRTCKNDSDSPASRRSVKSVDFHDSEPWVLVALTSGHVMIWNMQDESSSTVVPTPLFVSDKPVRCAKFVERLHSFVTASDDMKIRVFHDKTMKQIAEWEAHTDYIRSLDVHPTLPFLLSSSDDMSIKCWDMEYNYACHQVMKEHHVHYIMQVKINPHDTSTLASASLDRTIKVWKLGQADPLYTLRDTTMVSIVWTSVPSRAFLYRDRMIEPSRFGT
jgi:coatomer subunit beta'